MDVTTDTVNVVFEELSKTANKMSAISSEMKAITEKMSDLIQDIRNVWQDENGKTFTSRFETEVQSKFEKYYNTVQAYSDFIQGAHNAYVEHSSTTKAAVQGKVL